MLSDTKMGYLGDSKGHWSGYGKKRHATPKEFREGKRAGPSFFIVRRHPSSLRYVIRARFASQPPRALLLRGGWASKRFLLVVRAHLS
jgi:hypothetical protein